jgi:hypothetical protein
MVGHDDIIGLVPDADFMRAKAAICRRLAESTQQPGMRERLGRLADEFAAKARQLEEDRE